MKKLLVVLAILLMTGQAFADGVCTESFKVINTKNDGTYVYSGVKEVSFYCVADASNASFPSQAFSATVMEEIKGMYLLIGSTINGTPAPTNLYDIALTENSVDILGTGGYNRPGTAAVSSQFLPVGDTTYLANKPIPITNTLTQTITNNLVNSAIVVTRYKFVR